MTDCEMLIHNPNWELRGRCSPVFLTPNAWIGVFLILGRDGRENIKAVVQMA